MASKHLTGTQYTSSPHFDGYLKGIRDEFDRLNHELDETRKQRDEFKAKYRSQINELQELRQTVSCREEQRVQHGQGEIGNAFRDTGDNALVSPVSSSSEYHSSFEEEDLASHRGHNPENVEVVEGKGNQAGDDVGERDASYQNETSEGLAVTAGIVSLSPESNSTSTNKHGYSPWDVESNSDTTAALNLNLVQKWTQKGRTCLTFSMDGKYLATASSLGIISIFDAKTGERISVMKNLYKKDSHPYTCLEFSPDGKFLATGDADGNARIWIISQKRVRNTFGHRDIVTALNFSPNGQCLVTCSFDRGIKIWRLRDGSSRVLFIFGVYPWSVRCSLDGRYIASGCYSGHNLIWNMRTGKVVKKWRGVLGPVTSLVFTPDSKGLLSGSWDKQVTHWDVASLRSLGNSDPLNSDIMEISRLSGHKDNIYTVSISPDGKWIASGSLDKTVRIWSAHDASLHCVLHCPGRVSSIDFSPVGNYLAIGGNFDDVTIWNYASPQ